MQVIKIKIFINIGIYLRMSFYVSAPGDKLIIVSFSLSFNLHPHFNEYSIDFSDSSCHDMICELVLSTICGKIVLIASQRALLEGRSRQP